MSLRACAAPAGDSRCRHSPDTTSRNRSVVGADSRISCGPVDGTDTVIGASSMITCAFAPPAPNDDTAAIRGPALVHAPSVCCTRNGVAAKSMCGLSVSAWSDGASSRCCNWSSTFATPAMPAADSV